MSDRWRWLDWAMFGLAASLTLSPSLSIVEVAMLMLVLAGTTLGSAE